MSERGGVMLASVLLLCGGRAPAQSAPPATPESVAPARLALGFNPLRRCPDLRIARAEDRDIALVLFLVGPSGVPAHASVAASSGSQQLDAAAVSCVLKLRFQPAVRPGDGMPVESWRQLAWKWASSAARQGDPAAAAPPAAVAAPSPGGDAGQHRERSRPDSRAEVQVCVDESGRLTGEPTLTLASGDPQFDEAAVNIAKSGSGLYRAGTADGKPAAGCVRLAIGRSVP